MLSHGYYKYRDTCGVGLRGTTTTHTDENGVVCTVITREFDIQAEFDVVLTHTLSGDYWMKVTCMDMAFEQVVTLFTDVGGGDEHVHHGIRCHLFH